MPRADSAALALEVLEPAEQLCAIVSWFMADVGGPIDRLTIHVRGLHGAATGEVQLELGEVQSDWIEIAALDETDVWAVMAEFGLLPVPPERWIDPPDDRQQPADEKGIMYLERHATCRLSTHEVELLHELDNDKCPICQEGLGVGHAITCLPCGESSDGTAVGGHIAHKRCLHTWLKRADSCPLCRAKLPRRNDAKFTQTMRIAHKLLGTFCMEAEQRAAKPPKPSPEHVATPGRSAAKSSSSAQADRLAAEKRDEERRWRQALGKATRGRRTAAGGGGGWREHGQAGLPGKAVLATRVRARAVSV